MIANSPPQAFLDRIHEHNRLALIVAGFCLFGAWVGWMLAYGMALAVVSIFLIAIHGPTALLDERLTKFPWWIHPAIGTAAAALLLLAAWDQMRRRYRPERERPIIGLHILSDIALAPARLTFGIWDHLLAMICLGRESQREAFALLRLIYEERKCWRSSLGTQFIHPEHLPRLLAALQLAGLIDLHHGENDFFYIIPSNERDAVARMVEEENMQFEDSNPF